MENDTQYTPEYIDTRKNSRVERIILRKKKKKKKAGSLLQRSILMVDFGARNGKGRGDKRAPIKIDMKSRIHVEGTPLYR